MMLYCIVRAQRVNGSSRHFVFNGSIPKVKTDHQKYSDNHPIIYAWNPANGLQVIVPISFLGSYLQGWEWVKVKKQEDWFGRREGLMGGGGSKKIDSVDPKGCWGEAKSKNIFLNSDLLRCIFLIWSAQLKINVQSPPWNKIGQSSWPKWPTLSCGCCSLLRQCS